MQRSNGFAGSFNRCSRTDLIWSLPATLAAGSKDSSTTASSVLSRVACTENEFKIPWGRIWASRASSSNVFWPHSQTMRRPETGCTCWRALAPLAGCDDIRVCQTYLGSRIYPPVDWTNLSSLLTEILGPVFLAMEKNAPCWQRTRNSIAVTTMNELKLPSPQPTGTVEIDRLTNSFQLGLRDLQEIWGLVLPPATLFELRRISPQEFRIPDELWVKIIYDFALAHRLRTINRAHLLAFADAPVSGVGGLLRTGT